MKVIHVVRTSRAMLSPGHARCVYPHTMQQSKAPQVPPLSTRVDLTTLSTRIQELTAQLEVLEIDVCNLNYKLNTFMGLITQPPAPRTSGSVNWQSDNGISTAASMWLQLQQLAHP